MHTDPYLTVHQHRERELDRELELLRAAHACPGCVVHGRPRLAELAERVRARLAGAGAGAGAAVAPGCCPDCCPA